MCGGHKRYGTVRTVVWEDGGGDSASYPIEVLKPLLVRRGKRTPT